MHQPLCNLICCHSNLNLVFSWHIAIRYLLHSAYRCHDGQAIHLHSLESPIPWTKLPQSQNHYAALVKACDTIPVTVIKHFLPSAFFLPIFPVNYHSTDTWKTANLSSLRATSSWTFPKVLIAKSYEKLEVVLFLECSLWDIRAYKWLPLSPNWT